MWPDWLNEELPNLVETTFFLRRGDATLQWTSKLPANHTVRAVCSNCNLGWMADLEAVAKPILTPMIHGRRTRLTTADQRIVSAWALKTAVIGELLTPQTAVIPADQRIWLREHGEPPPAASVFIAATDAKWPGDTHYADGRMMSTQDPYPNVLIAYNATIGIRHLALQVLGAIVGGASFRHEAPIAEWVRKIWPASEVLDWPAGPFLAPDGFGALINHWQGERGPQPVWEHLQPASPNRATRRARKRHG